MTELKTNVELSFKKLGHLLFRNPLKVLLILFLFIGYMVYLNNLSTVDTSSEAMLREDDPTITNYNNFLDEFGRSELIIIAIQSKNIFDASFLTTLKSFHEEIEKKVPHTRSVNSLINARSTRSENDTLIVEALLKDWPGKSINLSNFRKQVMNNPFYINNIISEDGYSTAVIIELDASVVNTVEENEDDLFADFEEKSSFSKNSKDPFQPLSGKEHQEVIRAVNQIVENYNTHDFSLALSGLPVISDVYNRAIAEDMRYCGVFASISVLFFITILFRRISGIIFPFIIVQSSVFSTLGLMVLFKKPITELTVVLPTFLISVGIADSVHVLTIFYRQLQQGSSKEDAIAYALGHSGLAIVLTSLTTAAGLLSFYFAELTAIAEMGIFSAAGVILALVFTIFMLPPLIALVPIKQKKAQNNKITTSFMDKTLQFFTDISSTHPKKIIVASAVLLLISSAFIFRLGFSHNPLDYFPDTMDLKKHVVLIDKEFKGITTLEVVVDTKKENGIYDPFILNQIETLSNSIKKFKNKDIFVGKVFSINDILKESNQSLHGNNPAFYKIPQDRKTIAQELMLFENSGSEDLKKIVDSQFSKTRITIKTPNVDAVNYEPFIKEVKSRFQKAFQDKAEITLTGAVVLNARTVPVALRSMAKSYIAAFIVITIMMILLMGNIKFGLISMIPNLLPIIIVMGIMGVGNIPLNLTTIMIGSIAIGLVVDDTVHFMHNFQRHFKVYGNSYDAIHETLFTTGRAMLITSLILCSGFFVLMLATLNHLAKFGFFTGVIIILALLADFLLAPALMTLVTSDRKNSKRSYKAI